MKKISQILVLMLVLILSVSSVFATSGSIWTTNGDCGDESQYVNHYPIGDIVYVNGANFDPDEYEWSIEGQPGQASCDPGATVVSGIAEIEEEDDGGFCFPAYEVQSDDCGEYKVNFGNKHDNYRVDEQEPECDGECPRDIPEFTTIGAGLVLAGAGLYMYRKRKQ